MASVAGSPPESIAALPPTLKALRPLLDEVNDLKRIRVAGKVGSLGELGFVRGWRRLIVGIDPARVALAEAAHAVASARLGGIDSAILRDAGLTDREIHAILGEAVDLLAAPVGPDGLASLRSALPDLVSEAFERLDAGPSPEFVVKLCGQPRAGATRPGHARLVLEPPENHAEHCYVTAVYAVFVALRTNADAGRAFVAAMSHHFHNAYLPDSGFTGEELLGPHLTPIMDQFTARAMAQLPGPLAEVVRDAREILPHADSPEARAFHAGDVFDRVLQMEQYAKVAAFETRQALEDLDLVHPGPLLSYQTKVLAEVGLWGR